MRNLKQNHLYFNISYLESNDLKKDELQIYHLMLLVMILLAAYLSTTTWDWLDCGAKGFLAFLKYSCTLL